jgi:formyltetrahydrofolate deformylase
MENTTMNNRTAVLLIHCPDRRGIVASVTDFLHKNNGNIIHLDQHVDEQNRVFFMRVEWEMEGFNIPKEEFSKYFMYSVGNSFDMHFELRFTDRKMRVALFVSKLSHCLYDVLSRYVSGEWNIKIPVIISNHTVLEPVARLYGIDYHYLSMNVITKSQQEKVQLELLQKYNIDFVVLARYMQVLSGDFIHALGKPVINIHHSFLPAFPGAKPYHSAFERGVKLIGATAHYVTTELDAGPIIEQDVARVTHKHSVEDLIRKGADVEKLVLSRAIWQHVNHMTLVYKNKVIVFS